MNMIGKNCRNSLDAFLEKISFFWQIAVQWLLSLPFFFQFGFNEFNELNEVIDHINFTYPVSYY